ncbi:MAG: indolepyruvate ferredoxin oxidoreductase family protein [Gammaproteobacteria bacterium]|nr:MAG: indolepyruvate ferredoxin oxidoreductase family protein [Gammaproteobacteria bacterium]
MAMALAQVNLDDKYTLESGRIYLTGIQALVRLPIMQRQRDAAAGLDTAGFVSGYRGSPLGALDQMLWKARPFLERHNVHFQPGINEDLAATSVWGTQQVNMFDGARFDGVFGMWYGKGPGVDRSGDVFKHANAAGTSRYGGVLVVAGDDHACKSSTLPHQSEHAFMDAMMPVLNPSGVQEVLDLGVLGWELSRFCGCWIGFKTIAETVDSSASVIVDPQRVRIVAPEDFVLPDDGVHARWPDKPLEQEMRLQKYKLYAAVAFARVNGINKVVIDSPMPRIGIVTTGKSYLDVRQALEDLGIDEALAAQIGLRVLKLGMSWPLDREVVRDFAEGLEELLIVEEKRAVIENQVKEQLYNWRADVRPRVIGKFDEQDDWILPSTGELTPARIARVIADRIRPYHASPYIRQRLAFLEAKESALARPRAVLERVPHYCSGCPHNTSTVVPEGSRAMGGIGCHYMATWMDRGTDTFTQMGGEGVTWIGQAPFTDTRHVFQNLGDGTYFHSGLLAIRAAVAAGVNITYKILYNDAVAMTGGQPIDGVLSVSQITHQLHGEGIRRLAVVSDEPGKYTDLGAFAEGVTFHHRADLDRLQRQLREIRGVSVLIYDQTCAAEKRRRRKRGEMTDPAKRVFINQAVCEGCGDCGVQSNCLSVVPVETEFGRKRSIDQSACNKDMRCLDGFCPSFVSVHGGGLRRRSASRSSFAASLLPEPELPVLDDAYGIVITGVGGTGVTTVGALLGMAAHLEGHGCSVLDMTGLAQKYGSVVSHVRIARRPEDIRAVRISAGGARLLLGCDLVVASGFEALAKCDAGCTHAVVNAQESMTAAFLRQPDLLFPGADMKRAIDEAVGGHSLYARASRLAMALVGDAIGANLLLLGIAYQKGLVPVSADAIEQAIVLNGVAVQANRAVFDWGRHYAVDATAVLQAAGLEDVPKVPPTLEQIIARRETHLSAYQDTAYAQRYRSLVDRVRETEGRVLPGRQSLAEAVARNYAKLLAYKDEYEVARLHSDGEFARALEAEFEGDYQLKFHLAPPLLARRDPHTGIPRKRAFGPWVLPVFKLLSRLKGLRGTAFDPFGYSAERRAERTLIAEYRNTVEELLDGLCQSNYDDAVAITNLPQQVRGFGHIKAASIAQMQERRRELLQSFRNPAQRAAA